MAQTPGTKVFNAQDEYRASVKGYDEAAVLVSYFGAGATIRMGHTKADIIFTQTSRLQPLQEIVEICRQGAVDRRRARWKREREEREATYRQHRQKFGHPEDA